MAAAASGRGSGSPRVDATAAKVGVSGADAVFIGASDGTAAARLFNAVAAAYPTRSCSDPPGSTPTPSRARPARRAAQPLHLEPGLPGPADLTAGRPQFVADFRASEGHDPDQSAIFGYEAMAVVLDTLRRVGSTTPSLEANRGDVVKEFFSTRNRPSVLGTYSINENGDISIAPYVFSHFKLSKLVPFVAVQGN